MPFETSGYELAPWQERAVEAWQSGAGRPNTGTLEIFTGGGKTLMALECVSRVSQSVSDLQVAVVVPTVALAEQWVDVRAVPHPAEPSMAPDQDPSCHAVPLPDPFLLASAAAHDQYFHRVQVCPSRRHLSSVA